MDDNQAIQEDPKQSSKCHFTDLLPSTRPSLVSVVLIFVCGCLWMNNASLRTRRLAVEHRLQILSKECIANEELLRQASTPFTSQAPSVVMKSDKPTTRDGQRNHRQAPDDSSDMNFTMGNQFEQMENFFKQMDMFSENLENLQLIPIEYCNVTERLCPAGPPGPLGETGAMGPEGNPGRRGEKGRRGSKGSPRMDGVDGIPGPRGYKGETGPPRPRGPPGESLEVTSAPSVSVSSVKLREGGLTNIAAAFYCTVSGSPRPSISWHFKSQKLSSGEKFIRGDGTLLVFNRVSTRDIGRYTCMAANSIRSFEDSEFISLPQVTVFPSNQTQDGKEKAVFRCSVTGGYPPGYIQWQFNNKILQPGAKYTINEDDGSLLIKNLQFRGRSDSGNYTCVATNDAGSTSMSAQLSVAPVLEYCDCWRSSRRYYPIAGWKHSGKVDAIDFQTTGDVILQGFRLWGVTWSSTTFQVTIRLYHGNTLLAEKTGSYPTSYDKKTFKVYFPKQIKIRAGERYTATSKITTSSQTYYLRARTTRFVCSGVTVNFLGSSKDRNGSSRYRGQIPALIFRSLDC